MEKENVNTLDLCVDFVGLSTFYPRFWEDWERYLAKSLCPFWEGFKEPELTGNYHDLSHHGQKKEKIEKLLMLEHGIMNRISAALTSMKERQVGNTSLFDQTTNHSLAS